MSDPNREKMLYDDTDRQLMAALRAVEVPADLQARLESSLQLAMKEQQLLETPSVSEHSLKANYSESKLWNRRNAIAAAIAAGVGGLAFGFRQLTQPLSQAQLIAATQNLLDQVKRTKWESLTESNALAVRQSLQSFLKQVHGVSLNGFSRLQPPRGIQQATAYDFDNGFLLLDMTIERGVHRVTQTLGELPWSRSDTVAFAMRSEERTLVFAGPASIRGHILRPQTI